MASTFRGTIEWIVKGKMGRWRVATGPSAYATHEIQRRVRGSAATGAGEQDAGALSWVVAA
jgi:hypothetical protein